MNYTCNFFIIFIMLLTFKSISIDIPDTLIVKTLLKGENDEKFLKQQDFIKVNYTGWIFDKNKNTSNHCEAKGKLFDSNIIEKFNHVQHFQFTYGIGVVIKGWDIGLDGMKINEKRCLVIPPNLAYGSRGFGNIIEPNSTLIFEVQLIEIVENKEGKN